MSGAGDSDLKETAPVNKDLTVKRPRLPHTDLISGVSHVYQDACGAELRRGAAEAFGCQVNHELAICFRGGGAPLRERELVEFAFGALTVVAVAGGTGDRSTAGTVRRAW